MTRRILVTGVGGAPGFDLAASCRDLGNTVIAVDCDPHAPGLRMPGVEPHLTLPAADAGYRTALLRLVQECRPHAILSTVEQELGHLLALRRPLADSGVTTWLPPAAAVEACTDKAHFAHVLAVHGIPGPVTLLPDDVDQAPDGLLVVKPRSGQGSRHVHLCRSREQARVLCSLIGEAIVQEHVTGTEFTADCLVDRGGRASVILRHRLLVKGGLAVVSRTFTDAGAEACVRAVLTATGLRGACCVQGFIRGPHDEPSGSSGPGRVVITEANARIAGAFTTSVAAGADYIGEYLRGLFHHDVNHNRLTYRRDVTLTKYQATLTSTQGAPS
ncbi:carbamoyl phosphate synthase-like protein [Streptomyces sp. YIM 130001]|uniref:ATP-grasp domain-containing protein n=1 Tax=Streptomyces sp. YIM 130001 TaxID=2259644 RepID=UPI000E65C197|nr:ATP-grasp domain-containing protein [Streptomyces sp. YIM 130001]RII07988.1 carbamoyl phosphate synthase-like protein [Streptomyces sp. YIM 130001]